MRRLFAKSSGFVTSFSRFSSKPSGNNGGQHDTLRLLCHDANWRKHAESKASNTDALTTQFIIILGYFRLVVHTDAIIDTTAQRMVGHTVVQFAHGEQQNRLS